MTSRNGQEGTGDQDEGDAPTLWSQFVRNISPLVVSLDELKALSTQHDLPVVAWQFLDLEADGAMRPEESLRDHVRRLQQPGASCLGPHMEVRGWRGGGGGGVTTGNQGDGWQQECYLRPFNPYRKRDSNVEGYLIPQVKIRR